ncbi:MAG: Sua5/YciO/YrdC/YwlC family protein [Microgenomates group bacterium GW2011_GWC1_39_7b]|uniref:L-threonylcarbamoyladenylate synthase n=3 Tax=Candidatus Woeseibacteriota TaxID=1752722 RepID=A0A0G0LVY1_9BACT|nr:MAG: Sua5/YciO/YrdC/YwlC family protein [Candidatus Woesebacteria bacterium GW2011_GWB1_39_10]KKR26772.1 MAG: Sua5/YciO/YrdC/YwlC family protein [Microgenomates group bacterium GW2011_GWC1_39_7b]KKS91120.1 MAG: Sua5/YciO/YrdC/YwlC family protein [Candidatus Woesebacteria bacterium GW2011_GWA1_43_12]
MRIIKINKYTVGEVVKILNNGGLVIYPTETVYGAAVDPTNGIAVKKLVEYKNRPFGKPFSIAVTDIKMAGKYVYLNKTAKNLYGEFLPGPLTIISKGKHIVSPGVESEEGTLGIRIPDYQLVIDIVKAFRKPITSTSANASYKKRPYKISDILDNISEKQKGLIDLIIDIGELPKNDPSTVIDTTLDDIVTLRQGKVKFSNKNEVLSRGEENTKNLAKEIWQKYESHLGKRAIIFALQGEMGTGKTQFTKGLARAMGIEELVTSPTFNLVNHYSEGASSAYSLDHIDAWRMVNSDELKNLDFESFVKNKHVVAIEWAERVADVVREFDDEAIIIWIKIAPGKTENERLISWGNI